MNSDNLQAVFEQSDIDTRLSMRKSFPEINFCNKKIGTLSFTPQTPISTSEDTCEQVWSDYRVVKKMCPFCDSPHYDTYTTHATGTASLDWLATNIEIKNGLANNWIGSQCRCTRKGPPARLSIRAPPPKY